MKKLNGLVLSTLTAAFLVGCGGGSSDSSSGGTASPSTSGTTSPSTTSVPVTKGPLLQATAVDSSSPAKTGTQIDGTNKYNFTGTITYPIIVTGGYVDVNNNGIVDAGDYEFTGKLSSYSTVVTPITTYLGDTSKPEGEAKLKALKTLAGTNVSNDDLLKKDPTETNKDVLALLNTVYETYDVLMDDDSTNDDVSNIQSTNLSSKFESYKTVINQSTETDLSKILVVVEQELKNNKAPAKVLSDLDAKKINFNKKSVVGKKLVNDKETYFFRENDVVLADQNPDFTRVLSYESSEVGTLKLKFPADYKSNHYDLIAITDSGFTVTYYQPSAGEPQTITSTTLATYNQTELDEALKDVEFDISSIISGKELTITDSKGTMTAQFKAGGIYSEAWDDTISNGNKGTCEGTWKLSDYSKGIVDVTSTCSDKNTPESYQLIFNEEPKSGSKFKLWSVEEQTEETITTFKNIESSSSDNSSTFSLTEVMLSGKRYTLNPNNDGSYVIFTLNDNNTSSEIGYFANGSIEYIEDNATWNIVDGKLQITLSDNSIDTYTFATTPANGVTVTVKVSDESAFEAVVEDFSNISSNVISSSTSWYPWPQANTTYTSGHNPDGSSITSTVNSYSRLVQAFTQGFFSEDKTEYWGLWINHETLGDIQTRPNGSIVTKTGNVFVGTWSKNNSAQQLVLTLNNGEKIYLRVNNNYIEEGYLE